MLAHLKTKHIPSCPDPVSVPGRINSSATIGLGSSQCITWICFLAGVRDFLTKDIKAPQKKNDNLSRQVYKLDSRHS